MFRNLLPLALVLVVSGCVSGGPRDIAGKSMVYDKPVEITRYDSRVQFVGDAAPEVRKTSLRWRDNAIRLERVELATELTGLVTVEFARYLYSERSTRFIEDPENIKDKASRYCGSTPMEAKTGHNGSGDFTYVVCDHGGNHRCVVALQGANRTLGPRGAFGYTAIVDFRYCSKTESEEEILQRLASVKIVD